MTYPSSLDELTDGVPADNIAATTAMDDATYPHDHHHRALAVAVEAVELELGTDPSGSESTVKARIAATETVANAAAAKASNLSDIASASSARTNLGLGGAATLAVGTSAGTVAAGDDSRITGAVPKSTVTTAGDLIYGTGNAAVSRLGIGSALQVLRTNADATAPEWATVSSGAMSVIARTVLGSDTASVDFTSIPATYENLMVTYLARGTASNTWSRVWLRLNGDSGSNYQYASGGRTGASWTGVDNGSGQAQIPVGLLPDAAATASYPAIGTVNVIGYARTVFNKAVTSADASAASTSNHANVIAGGLWLSTAAVNQVTMLASSGNFKTGSVFTLYGIAGS